VSTDRSESLSNTNPDIEAYGQTIFSTFDNSRRARGQTFYN